MLPGWSRIVKEASLFVISSLLAILRAGDSPFPFRTAWRANWKMHIPTIHSRLISKTLLARPGWKRSTVVFFVLKSQSISQRPKKNCRWSRSVDRWPPFSMIHKWPPVLSCVWLSPERTHMDLWWSVAGKTKLRPTVENRESRSTKVTEKHANVNASLMTLAGPVSLLLCTYQPIPFRYEVGDF